MQFLTAAVVGALAAGCSRHDPVEQSLAWARSVRPMVWDYAVIQQQRQCRERANQAFSQQLNAAEEAKIPYAGIVEYPATWPQISEMREAARGVRRTGEGVSE